MAEIDDTANHKGTVPIYRPKGVNTSEQYLAKLCDHSFLSLWSYPSLSRDQGRYKARGDGKELCDLLVVFGDDILIFQDKECVFNDSGDLQLDWSRWYRAAIKEGVKQIWGAERWIKENPNLIFLDRLCTQPFPFAFPDADKARYHRIIVAHGAAERCKQELGGSGSLMIMANAVGPVTSGADKGNQPFTTAQIEPSKGFVHIFDDTTLDIVLQTLDTISDFVAYLTKKEAFVSSRRFISAAGEEELLALYLTKLNPDREHDFVFPTESSLIMLGEGGWDNFCRNPQRKAQLEANEISYAWDALIEGFNTHNLAGTQHFVTHSIKEIEVAVRFLAGENRTSRRFLSEKFSEIIWRTPSNKRAVRVTKSPWQKDLYYVFMVFPHHKNHSEDEYRIVRRNHLMDYCMVAKLKFPDAKHIVGIATDAGMDKWRSEDLVYYDASIWSEEEQKEAKSLQKQFNMLKSVRRFTGNVQEYPNVGISSQFGKHENVQYQKPSKIRVGRNDPCPCGSGNKYKRCHGN